MLRVLIFLLFFAVQVFSSDSEARNILNFSAVNGARDMIRLNDTIFIATGGGLASFQNSGGNFISLYHSHEQFPEISLSALEADDDGLWIGSENGYLYYRQKSRRQKIYDDLYTVKAQIYQIKNHKNHLIIAHSKGLSIFDKKNGNIVSTRRNFEKLPNSYANLIAMKNNSLFVAVKSDNGKSGVLRLDNFENFLSDVRMNDNSPFEAQIPWQTEITPQDEEIKTIYFNKDDKISASGKLVIFGENYKIEREWSNWLLKIDNSETQISSADLKSEITFLKLIDGKVAAGTKYDFAYLLDENLDLSNHKQFVTPGLVNTMEVSKLFVDSENSLWILPRIPTNTELWSNALTRMTRNGSTDYYKYQNGLWTDGFGPTTLDCGLFTGVAQSGSKMFFGKCGDPLRQFDMNTNQWGRWFFDIRTDGKIPFSFSNTAKFVSANGWNEEYSFGNEYYWVKLDNIVNIGDKIYGTYWRNIGLGDVEMPMLFELNPDNGNFRFLLKNLRLDLAVPNGLVANDDGLLITFQGSNELWFISNKNYDSVEDILKISNNPVKLHTTGAKNIFIATSGAPVIFSKSKIIPIKNLPERFMLQTNDIVPEYSEEFLWSENENQKRIRNVFWIANKTVGAERVIIDEYVSTINGGLDSAVYDTQQPIFAFSPLNGAINDNITALTIDTVQNFLWIGGDKGITRVMLPERNLEENSAKKDFVFPNPFVLSRHQTLSIPALQNSFVDIYTISGKLVKHIDENSAGYTKTIDGSSIYKWDIPQNLAAGNYIIVVKPLESDKVNGKKTKQYKLLVIK